MQPMQTHGLSEDSTTMAIGRLFCGGDGGVRGCGCGAGASVEVVLEVEEEAAIVSVHLDASAARGRPYHDRDGASEDGTEDPELAPTASKSSSKSK